MVGQKHPEAPARKPKYQSIDRAQGKFCTLMVDQLVGDDHPARLIWEIVGKLDLRAFEIDVASFEKEAGRAAWSPQILISVLVYGYTLGTGSAREIERLMSWEPGLRWLMGMETINHHTLSDFRRQDEEKLKKVFQQVLGLLANEDLVDWATLLQDGTKMKAQASKQSMRRRPTLEEHLAAAKQCVEELDQQAAAQDQAAREGKKKATKKEAAQQRAAREKLARMEAALKELEQREAVAEAKEKGQVRVSETEPEVKRMKHPDGGFAPSYNVQMVTEGQNGFIVGWTVSAALNDLHELTPGLTMATSLTGQPAKTVIADGGYASRQNIEEMALQGVEFVAPRVEEAQRVKGSLKRAGIAPEFAPTAFTCTEEGKGLRCPAGQTLVHIGVRKHHGLPVNRYEAEASACGACPHKPQCSPQRAARRIERVIESEAVQAHDRRMVEPEVIEKYKRRKQLAEYPHLRIKSNWRLNRFRLRGLANVAKETFWMVLAFTMDRWHYFRNRPAQPVPMVA